MPTPHEQILAYLESASERLQHILLNPGGTTEKSQEWRRARAAAQLNSVRAEIRGLKGQLANAVVKQLGSAYRQGLTKAIGQAKDAGIHEPAGTAGLMTGNFSVIDRHALQVIAQDAVADLSKAVDGMESTAQRVLRKTAENGMTQADIDAIVAGRVITGDRAEAKRTMAAELKRIHGGNVITIIDKNGDPMMFKAGHYAEMVVRTKTSEAIRKGTVNRLGELGQDLVVIHGAQSKNFCTAFLGKIFSISGKSERYPALASLPGGGPPFHPNCSKSISLWVEEFHTAEENAAGELDDDERKLLGKDASKAHRTWLDLQIRQKQQASRAAKSTVTASGPRIEARSPVVKEMAESVVKELTAQGYKDLPPVIERAAEFVIHPNAMALYGRASREVYVNPNVDWKRRSELMQQMHDVGYASSSHPDHVVYHEIGHYVHHKSVGTKRFVSMRNEPFEFAERLIVERYVSSYAATRKTEFVAEVFAAKAAGRKMPEAIEKLYRDLGGA